MIINSESNVARLRLRRLECSPRVVFTGPKLGNEDETKNRTATNKIQNRLRFLSNEFRHYDDSQIDHAKELRCV